MAASLAARSQRAGFSRLALPAAPANVRCFVYQAGGEKRVYGLPGKRGLYDPAQERDACGTGFVVDVAGE
jgi:hypothetical protein